ncbi:MAG: dihydropteroate synthase [Gammaproteobacteria bacterium]|nr:dihydropteroate synthase [Gammaproteobacteria bacterium]
MGVINVTPDSFSDGARFYGAARAHGGTRPAPELNRIVDAARAMLDAGADILDVGGESTRPGADPVSEDEEARRVMPVLEQLLQFDTIVSLDTSKPALAARALAAGVQLINDVTGGRDLRMLEVVADSSAAYCVMHMLGEPRTMQQDPRYGDVVAEVRGFLAQRVADCGRAGIGPDRLLLDPGFGFGKTLAHNLTLLRHLDAVRVDDLPLLVGMSRKRMIGTITGRDLGDRAAGSAAAALLAVQRGAEVVRVHDVAETVDALKMLAAVEGNST